MFYVLISLVTSKKTSGMQGRIRLILMFFCHQNGFDELEVQGIKYHSCKNIRRKISCASRYEVYKWICRFWVFFRDQILQVFFLLAGFCCVKTRGFGVFLPKRVGFPGSAEEAQRRLEGAIEARLEGLVLKDSLSPEAGWVTVVSHGWGKDLGVEVEVDSQILLVNMMMLLLHPHV